MYKELLQYHLSHNMWEPRFLLREGPRVPRIGSRKGRLLNLQTKSLISSWVDEKNRDDFYNENNFPYDFELILQGTLDGFSRKMFERKCYDVQQTVAITNIKETGEIIGVYNPVCWNIKER